MSKSAFVAVVGRPSAGKSTLVNSICGHKVSIVSPVPQTTRNAVRGILSETRGQLVFVDTPGFHNSDRKFNKRLTGVMRSSLDDADIVLYVVDQTRSAGEEERMILERVVQVECPVIVVFNKSDLVEPGAAAPVSPPPAASIPPVATVAPGVGRPTEGLDGAEDEDAYQAPSDAPPLDPDSREALKAGIRAALPAATFLELSAKEGYGIKQLKSALFEKAPEGQAWYPNEFYTDQDPSFRIAEIIREQVMNRTHDEIPHAAFVEIEDLTLRDATGKNLPPGTDMSDMEALPEESRPRLHIHASICVERESQKGIVIGSKGSLIKTIRTESEKAMRKIFPWRIELDLHVKVSAKWRSNDKLIDGLIH